MTSLPMLQHHLEDSDQMSDQIRISMIDDVTIVADDHKQISAHKLVLSACSEYFRNIFQNNSKHAHPLLCLDGISSTDVENILDYMYNGEIKIYQENLDRFLNVDQRFRLEGLLSDKSESDYNILEDTESRYLENEIILKEDKASHPIRKMARNIQLGSLEMRLSFSPISQPKMHQF